MADLPELRENYVITDEDCNKDFVDPFPNCRLSELVARMLGEDYMDKEDDHTEYLNDPFESGHDVQPAFISYLGDFKYLFREPLPSIEESEFEDELADEIKISKPYQVEDNPERFNLDSLERNHSIESHNISGREIGVQTQNERLQYEFDLGENNYVIQSELQQTSNEQTLSIEVEKTDQNLTLHEVSMDYINEAYMYQQLPDEEQKCKFSWSVTSV